MIDSNVLGSIIKHPEVIKKEHIDKIVQHRMSGRVARAIANHPETTDEHFDEFPEVHHRHIARSSRASPEALMKIIAQPTYYDNRETKKFAVANGTISGEHLNKVLDGHGTDSSTDYAAHAIEYNPNITKKHLTDILSKPDEKRPHGDYNSEYHARKDKLARHKILALDHSLADDSHFKLGLESSEPRVVYAAKRAKQTNDNLNSLVDEYNKRNDNGSSN